MERKPILLILLLGTLTLSACSTNNATNGKHDTIVPTPSYLYNVQGMELSQIVSQMSTTLEKTMRRDLDAVSVSDTGEVVKEALPRVAVTSFVDTDTYETADYLGRSLAEFFIHELDRRSIPVFDFKLTKNLSVTKQGEFIFSRDWKKLARQAMVKRVLGGTFTKNREGIVVSARIVNMETNAVEGSATAFIPYRVLPACYRTSNKSCDLDLKKDINYRDPAPKALTNSKGVPPLKTPAQTAREHRAEFNNAYYGADATVPATSSGNYEKNEEQKQKAKDRTFTDYIKGLFASEGDSTIIYPADSYLVKGRLHRDIKDRSQYERVKE